MSQGEDRRPTEDPARGLAIAQAPAAGAYSPVVARKTVGIRPAVLADLAFIDAMQKQHSRELGFLPTKALEGKIKLQQGLIAEAGASQEEKNSSDNLPSPAPCPFALAPVPVGYLIAADRYQKRDEIGYVTQISVKPGWRRHLVAGQLLQAQFDRSAYGCKLYSCWCAQDLAANEFWEAMGFTAIAFRTGSMKKGKKLLASGPSPAAGEDKDPAASASQGRSGYGQRTAGNACSPRVHIFWQKRIRAGDDTTPWWYPSMTGGGEIREDRLVFPIPAGVHWRDVGPIVLEKTEDPGLTPALQDASAVSARPVASRAQPKAKPMPAPNASPVKPKARGGMWFEAAVVPDPKSAGPATPVKPATPKVKKPKATIDPRLKAMSRELRDQWAERADQAVQPAIGKHDVKRIAQPSAGPGRQVDRADVGELGSTPGVAAESSRAA